MLSRMEILKDIMPKLNQYTVMDPWRPSLVDLWVYNSLINMHESDYDNGSELPDFIWSQTPDQIMEHIIQSGRIFDLEYGWDSLDEEIRDYLIIEDFIKDPLDEQVSLDVE